MPRPLLIAHRGASINAPENTLASFKKALEIGVDLIEFDIHLSSDNIPIVIHDASFKRTTNYKKRYSVTTLTLEKIKQMDAGSWFHEQYTGEQIPTLEEVLQLDLKETGLMIELKPSRKNYEQLAELTIELLKAYFPNSPQNIYLGSFSHEILAYLLAAGCPFPLLGIGATHHSLSKHIEIGIRHLAADHLILSSRKINYYKNIGTTLWAWTVNHPQKAEQLLTQGVDGIITNDPHLISPLFNFENIEKIEKVAENSLKA